MSIYDWIGLVGMEYIRLDGYKGDDDYREMFNTLMLDLVHQAFIICSMLKVIV